MPASNKPSIVFLCVENSNRSQMAEGFARHYGGALVEVWSAGSAPSGVVHPKAVILMRERGIDLTRHQSKGLDRLPDIEWDWLVTMGCGEQGCPTLRAKRREDWAIADPKKMAPEEAAMVRDEIERRVLDLLKRIETQAETRAD